MMTASVETRSRPLHPGAWWIWALGLAAAASRTNNPWVLLLILMAAGYVVVSCRGNEPWSRAYRVFLILGFAAIGIRVIFHVLLGGHPGPTILFALPAIDLGDWAQGIRVGGPVSLEGLLAAFYDGLRLATLLACVGAANALASPRRLVRSMPAALYEVSVAVVVALTVAPQLVESTRRIHRARALRGDTRRGIRHVLRRVLAPVLHDALDRSLDLAAAMDSRGYGRTVGIPLRTRRLTAGLLLVGLLGMCVGVYGLLGAQTSTPIAIALLAVGAGMAFVGILVAAARVPRTRYRPDPFGLRGWVVALSGVGVLVGLIAAEVMSLQELIVETNPLVFPPLPVFALLGIGVGLVPAFVMPTPKYVTEDRGKST